MLRMLSYSDVYSQQGTRRMKAVEAAAYCRMTLLVSIK
jgi:hypothetical protein